MYPGTIKQQLEDWRVCEISPETWSGSGEHAYFYVRKQGMNTADLVRAAAVAFDVPRIDVGYAGRKDKQGITEQWLSVRTPCNAWPAIDHTECLAQTRHSKKLKIGQLRGNRFAIILRDTRLTPEQVLARGNVGFANAFGPQRLSGDNVAQAEAWIAQRERVVDRRRQGKRRGAGKRQRGNDQQGWHLSVLRSYLFNAVLEKRLELNPGGPVRVIEGDVLLAGFPTAPLWGRGRSASAALALQIEVEVLAPHRQLCDALEHAGVRQGRRALWCKPGNLEVAEIAADTLKLEFFLPPGSYATAWLMSLQACP